MIWPFGIMLLALRSWRKSWSKNIFWAFCIFFGFTFVIVENIEDAADSARYAQLLVEYSNSVLDFKSLIRSFYSESSAYVDVAQPIITYLVSIFTVNPSILFSVFAMIFGFFYSRNIWYILSNIKDDLNPLLILFIFVFALTNPIWFINGFRMWTAAQIFVYGALPFLFEGKYQKLFWSFLSIFFHFSFLTPIAILLIYILFKNRRNVYMGFFIITFFLKELDLQVVQSYLSFLPSIFQARVGGYLNVEYAESIVMARQEYNWYIILAPKALEWVIFIIVMFLFFLRREILEKQKGLINLFYFSILFFSFANILSLVPSGGRFANVGYAFMFFSFSIFLSRFPEDPGLKIITILSVPFILLYSLVAIRVGTEFFGFVTIIGNPVFAALGAESAPLITEIMSLL